MADISKISLPDGTTYSIKDSNALTDDLFNMTPIPVTVQPVEEGDVYNRYFIPMSAIPLVEHRRPIYLAFPGFAPGSYFKVMLYFARSEPIPDENSFTYNIIYASPYSSTLGAWVIDTTTGELLDAT